MTRDDIVGILNDEVKGAYGDEFEVCWLCGDLCLAIKEIGFLAVFADFKPQSFYLGSILVDEFEWEITDGSVKFEKFMEVTKLFYAEAKPLFEEYWDE